LSISSVLSGSGTTTPKFQLSRSVLDTETLNIDYDSSTGNTLAVAAPNVEVETISNAAVTNNVVGTAPTKSMLINFYGSGSTLPSNVNDVVDPASGADKITSPIDTDENAIAWNIDISTWTADATTEVANDYNDIVNVAMGDRSFRTSSTETITITGLDANETYTIRATGGNNGYDTAMRMTVGATNDQWVMQDGRDSVDDSSFAEIVVDSDGIGEIEITLDRIVLGADNLAFLCSMKITGPAS
jgi:hypothetical protein